MSDPVPAPQVHAAAAIRILDATSNRATEALRVVEDHARFVLDDPHLTEQWKRLRHDLTAALSPLSPSLRAECRQTQHDVGTTISTPSERQRADLNDVLSANLARVQQALRTLEEYAKVPLVPFVPDAEGLSAELEAMRYRSYTLAAAMEVTRSSQDRLQSVRLMVLVEGQAEPETFEHLVTDLFAAGVPVIQLRDKHLTGRHLLDRAQRLVALAKKLGVLAIINDRADIAAASQAHGVHLGQDDLSVAQARRIVGPQVLIGVSTHSLAQAQQAVIDGANYIGVGPTFPSSTKVFDHFPGPELLSEVAQQIRLPAFAIGGIEPSNIGQVLLCGVTRIAVGSAITAASDPARAARELLHHVGQAIA
ncbi:MAG: thiamine phosphate synthase [Planctomycetes bacterium]|nr:thiamine phosphate synthase [Planctomycetota bacterium]